jgi:hypothetical protein
MGDPLREWMEKPENRTKIYYAFNIGIIITNLLIALGAIIFVLKILQII